MTYPEPVNAADEAFMVEQERMRAELVTSDTPRPPMTQSEPVVSRPQMLRTLVEGARIYRGQLHKLLDSDYEVIVAALDAAQTPVQPVHRASLTRNTKFGAAIWLDGRLVARIEADVESSRTTPEEPEPRWLRDAMVLVNAVNRESPVQPVLSGLEGEVRQLRYTILQIAELSNRGEGDDVAVAVELARIVAGHVTSEALGVTNACTEDDHPLGVHLHGAARFIRLAATAPAADEGPSR